MRLFHWIFVICLLNACQPKASVDLNSLSHIPTSDAVGAARMPDTIAAISAPFPTINLRKPTFPARSISIEDRGLKKGQLATGLIQQAIDELSASGGGKVIIPSGKWNTGRISLKSNVNLYLSEGAKLYFSGEIKDYLPVVFTRNEGIELMSLGACIYANGQENIAVTGKGKLVGPAEGSVRERIMTHDVIENVVALDKPVKERVYDGNNEGFIFPPMFIAPINCTNVLIEGISLERTAFWNIVPQYCDRVIIRGVTINSIGIPRGDGIDIESSKNVLVEYCTLRTGDDCLAMKAGRGWDGLRVNKPTENVVVRYCLAEKGHGGITIGSETAGVIRNLYVHDCVFNNEGNGIRFKTRRPRGGGGEKLYYERIRMNVGETALRWDMLGSAVHVGAAADRSTKIAVNKLTPHFKDIQIKDLIIENASQFVRIDGIPESPLENVMIRNVQSNSEKLFEATDARNIQLTNALLKSKDDTLHGLNIKNIGFEGVQFDIPTKKILFDMPDVEDEHAISLKNISY
ncbi:glycoside hydrolase family 28 protein [Olivibacter domesticus]|uniref:Glycosyl hydrolases family 28 n=1 Tax=Olivibacter domesticus TaxID=407022 RepID=A0A1H7U0E4_OLID1|nr:glycoside hydrolase family 28 protein [Olivibacter domesticus]SEL90158.1 Glycosyl hydrolases family 28 [Olivibacter domesticus]